MFCDEFSNMRKYQQLLLLIVSIVCTVTLLFYRHEYLKLRSVLSVLDFFGTVDKGNSTCLTFSNDLTKDVTAKYQFEEPRSVWMKLGDYYVYSSFWENSEEGGFTRTLVLGPKSTFYNFKCRIWFEEGDIIISEKGLLKFELDLRSLRKNQSTRKYFLRCIVQNKPTHAVPYGVLWSATDNDGIPVSVFSPIFSQPRVTLLDSAICVLPDYSGLPKTNFIEFITYYNTLGVSNFIIYDSGIQHSIFPFLESVSGRDGILSSVSVLRWNFPVVDAELERVAIKDDCLSRTFGKAKFVAIVSLDDYIVPKKLKLNRIVSPNKITDLLNLSMNKRLCCTNLDDDKSTKRSWPLFLRKNKCLKYNNTDDMLFINFKSYGDMNKDRIYEVSEDLAVINHYGICDDSLVTKASIVSLPEYFSRLNSHRLLMLWKSHLNTTSIFS